MKKEACFVEHGSASEAQIIELKKDYRVYSVYNIKNVRVEKERSLRDWFAGMAMQTLLCDKRYELSSLETISSISYEVADTMIKERDEKHNLNNSRQGSCEEQREENNQGEGKDDGGFVSGSFGLRAGLPKTDTSKT